MKIASLFSQHILRPSTTKQGVASELVQQLRKICNHQTTHPTPKKPTHIEINLIPLGQPIPGNSSKTLEKTAEYKQLVSETSQKMWKEFARTERQNAYSLRQSYTANGGMFSYAQQLANKSGANVVGVKGEYIRSSEENKQQYILFRPQTKLLEIISNFGNYFLSKWR